MKLYCKALSPKIGREIPAPYYASPGAAALDLHACTDAAVTIPGRRAGRCSHWDCHRPARPGVCGC